VGRIRCGYVCTFTRAYAAVKVPLRGFYAPGQVCYAAVTGGPPGGGRRGRPSTRSTGVWARARARGDGSVGLLPSLQVSPCGSWWHLAPDPGTAEYEEHHR